MIAVVIFVVCVIAGIAVWFIVKKKGRASHQSDDEVEEEVEMTAKGNGKEDYANLPLN